MTPEQLAIFMHDAREKLSPIYYKTTIPDTSVLEWSRIADDNPYKALTIAIASEILKCLNSYKCNHCDRQDVTVRKYLELLKRKFVILEDVIEEVKNLQFSIKSELDKDMLKKLVDTLPLEDEDE